MQHASIKRCIQLSLSAMLLVGMSIGAQAAQADPSPLAPVTERFAAADAKETPDFQRHVIPTMTRLGCNGRSCHGSFQGQGGFALSLFGYDYEADHKAIAEGDKPRANVKDAEKSLVLFKPTHEDEHEGGERFKPGSWQYNLIRNWISAGAPFNYEKIGRLARLEITPSQIDFTRNGETIDLHVVAVWDDGSREDVTPLARFKTNDEMVAKVDEKGRVTSLQAGDTHIVVFYESGVQPVTVLRPVSDLVGDKYPNVAAPSKIDRLVVSKLRRLGIVPSELADDAQFLRRLRLDLTGTLPSPKEIEAFLADRSEDKRDRKIDELLQSSAYAAWWTTKLCDFTGNNTAQLRNATIGGTASQEWYDWLYRRVESNVPYDQIAAGIVTAKSREPGQSYTAYCEQMSALHKPGSDKSFADRKEMPYYWARINFRTPEERVIGFAYTFLGLRIQCAQCHKHPFDQWTKKDFDDFKGFFNGVVTRTVAPGKENKEQLDAILAKLGVDATGSNKGNIQKEITRYLNDGKVVPFPELVILPPGGAGFGKGKNGKQGQREERSATGRLLGGETIDLSKFADPREPLIDWLRSPQNPYFARAFVNRVWAAYFNVGIVEPADDLSRANPPSNAPLLDYLAQGFIEHHYDMKWLHREITKSRTYQLSWQPNETNRADQHNFSHSVPRRLPAEVAVDALTQATASDAEIERLSRQTTGRAISIPGTGYGNKGRTSDFALTVFGRSIRESNCDCDRSSDPSLLQTVFLQNDRETLALFDRKEGWLAQIGMATSEKKPDGDRKRDGDKKDDDKNKKENDNKQQAKGKDSDKGDSAPKGAESLAEVRTRLDRVENHLKLARLAMNVDLVGELTRRQEHLRQRMSELRRFAVPAEANQTAAQNKNDAPVKTAAARNLDVELLIRQAYLRTLSRFPEQDELAIAREHVRGAANAFDGLRDLLWALVNTKEFIVNH